MSEATPTTIEAKRVNDLVMRFIRPLIGTPELEQTIKLNRTDTIAYLKRMLYTDQPEYLISLSVARPFNLFWISRALDALDALDEDTATDIAKTILALQHPGGGFKGHLSCGAHTITTYSALTTLVIVSPHTRVPVLDLIDRPGLYSYLSSVHMPDGSYRMEPDGEIDMRAVYAAVISGKIAGIWTSELEAGVVDFILSCQTYEGGLAAAPGLEAHGSFTGLGLAALDLIKGDLGGLDVARLQRWVVYRQTEEGGFNGRTNKVVDGCYSTWLGMACGVLARHGYSTITDPVALQRYLLAACQCPGGGLLDKPDCSRDAYHTCYDLCGLSMAQMLPGARVYGDASNSVGPTDPRFNVKPGVVAAIEAWTRANIIRS
ncbi:Prenyltransferase-like [Carpediemonas membranifera]|uniref:Prenyltransferase-like n=1 Tax=Carpediemonas membranifera TaxID=201153 RepID=A0A8J6E1F9_9EUKA|nr:Prenyltransferase-like [Carpediemonas membranifera]|eukprot:KAG9393011.1 Prenyltransferase-like [Carpediemonas membranifera]